MDNKPKVWHKQNPQKSHNKRFRDNKEHDKIPDLNREKRCIFTDKSFYKEFYILNTMKPGKEILNYTQWVPVSKEFYDDFLTKKPAEEVMKFHEAFFQVEIYLVQQHYYTELLKYLRKHTENSTRIDMAETKLKKIKRNIWNWKKTLSDLQEEWGYIVEEKIEEYNKDCLEYEFDRYKENQQKKDTKIKEEEMQTSINIQNTLDQFEHDMEDAVEKMKNKGNFFD